MNLTPQQLKTQEAMLLRLYPGKSLEEAKDKDAVLIGCIRDNGGRNKKVSHRAMYRKSAEEYMVHCYGGTGFFIEKSGIIGLPPTLPRVLDALGSEWLWDGVGMFHIGKPTHTVFERKRRNEDGSDAILWDQEQKTQDIVGELMK